VAHMEVRCIIVFMGKPEGNDRSEDLCVGGDNIKTDL
jgi:hypothetical protein